MAGPEGTASTHHANGAGAAGGSPGPVFVRPGPGTRRSNVRAPSRIFHVAPRRNLTRNRENSLTQKLVGAGAVPGAEGLGGRLRHAQHPVPVAAAPRTARDAFPRGRRTAAEPAALARPWHGSGPPAASGSAPRFPPSVPERAGATRPRPLAPTAPEPRAAGSPSPQALVTEDLPTEAPRGPPGQDCTLARAQPTRTESARAPCRLQAALSPPRRACRVGHGLPGPDGLPRRVCPPTEARRNPRGRSPRQPLPARRLCSDPSPSSVRAATTARATPVVLLRREDSEPCFPCSSAWSVAPFSPWG
jgi:hypothetical protein